MDMILDIEECTTFEEVAENKRYAYFVNTKSQLNINGILADLYTDPTHFIFELIQNAEDAGAKKVNIKLESRRLIFRHDGRPFDLRDVKGITSVNYSPKADDYTKIGRFGIGFKAVFGICDEPEIYSGEYNFRIRNFYVPEKLPPRENRETEIVLHFKEGAQEEIYLKIEETLASLRAEALLFLRNIKQIDYLTNTKCGYYLRERIPKQIEGRNYFESSIKVSGGILSKYLVFEAPLDSSVFSSEVVNDANPLYVSVAYRVDEKSGKIVSDGESTKLVVYFPTERETHLQFKINGPFRTTPTRENIPFTPENDAILEAIVSLYRESILTIKALGALSIAFCEMLPLNPRRFDSERSDPVYEAFQTATADLFDKEELLPAKGGGYTLPAVAVLARGQITDLLEQKDLEMLFDGRDRWLSTDITEKSRNFYSFLKNILEVEEVDFDAFMAASNSEFFLRKSDSWFIKFYRRADANLQTMQNRHLLKKFIKTESGEMVAPFVNISGKRQKNVYLPSDLITDERRIVKKALIKNADVSRFFSHIGIERMDVVESIRTQWIPSLNDCTDEAQYVAKIKNLYREYSEQKPQKQKELAELLQNAEIIYRKEKSGAVNYFKPDKVFLPASPAETLYGGCKDAIFLPPLLAETVKKDAGFSAFLRELGVQTGLVLVQKSDFLTYEERRKLMQGARYSWYAETSYQIKHIGYLLENMTPERSHELWRQINALSPEFFTGKLHWGYYNDRRVKEFEAPFVRRLQDNDWLFDRQGELVSPSDLCEDEVRELYGGGIALRYFCFKADLVQTLPEELRDKVNFVNKYSMEDLQLMAELYDAQRASAPYAIDIDPEASPAAIEDAEFTNPAEGMTAEEFIGGGAAQTGNGFGDTAAGLYGSGAPRPETAPNAAVKQTSDEAQVLGALGEKIVLAALKKHCRELGYAIYNEAEDGFSAKQGEKIYDFKRQNSEVRVQKGYDIAIFKRDEIVQYIEVKTKRSAQKEYFAVSGPQWEFAKKLYEEGSGGKYFVYVVTNAEDEAGKRVTRVSNPYEEWLNGKLEADPVRIKY